MSGTRLALALLVFNNVFYHIRLGDEEETAMELKDFVAEALVQIQEGVQEAIERRSQDSEAAGAISPHHLNLKAFDSLNPNDWDKYVQKVDFDLAISVSDKKGAEGKGSIKIFNIADVGGSKSKSSETNTVCRVKFTIPIVPPVQRL